MTNFAETPIKGRMECVQARSVILSAYKNCQPTKLNISSDLNYLLCRSRYQASWCGIPFHVWRQPGEPPWLEFYRAEKSYLLRFPDLAEFEISADGGQIRGFAVPGVPDATVEHLYLTQVLPLALSRTGKLVIHAGAVDIDGNAVAFIGDTGRGKSTLAAAFAVAGHRFLSDDSLVVEIAGTEFRAMPSNPSIRLWQDSQQHLLDERAAKAPPVNYTSKARFLAGEALTYCDEPKRLRVAYVLGPEHTEGVQTSRNVTGVIA